MAVLQIFHAYLGEALLCPQAYLLARQTHVLKGEGRFLQHREARAGQLVERTLEDEANPLRELSDSGLSGVFSGDVHPAGELPLEEVRYIAGDQAAEGGFAGLGEAGDTDEASLLDGATQVPESGLMLLRAVGEGEVFDLYQAHSTIRHNATNTTMAAMDQRITRSLILSGTSIKWLRNPDLLNPLASRASDLVSTEIKAPARSGIIMAKRAWKRRQRFALRSNPRACWASIMARARRRISGTNWSEAINTEASLGDHPLSIKATIIAL